MPIPLCWDLLSCALLVVLCRWGPLFRGSLDELLALLKPVSIGKIYADNNFAYEKGIPAERPVTGKKNTRRMEREHLTLRTHVKRLCRKTRCFSKSKEIHIAIVGSFINCFFGPHFWCFNFSVTSPQMNSKERLEKLEEEEHLGGFGGKERTFKEMQKALEADYDQRHKKRGGPPKPSILDKLVIMLQHYREYRSIRHVAFNYGVVTSTIRDRVARADRMLIRSGLFRLLSKRKLLEADSPVEAVIADVAECEIKRPKKEQKNYYSGKKKRHT